jgi:hypothetical protein
MTIPATSVSGERLVFFNGLIAKSKVHAQGNKKRHQPRIDESIDK